MRDLNGRGTVAAQHWSRKAIMSKTALILETHGSVTRLVLNRPQMMIELNLTVFEGYPGVKRHFPHICAGAPG